MLQKVLLLGGLIVLGTHLCNIHKEFVDISKNLDYFVASVQFAVARFNDSTMEEYTYTFLEVGRAQQKKSTMVFLIDVELGRTTCKKHDEDIDNCPLQDGAGEKSVRCTFIVDARPWISLFYLLKSTCEQKT